MLSSKGFLAPGPDRRPRMTAKHKAAVSEAIKALRDSAIDYKDGAVGSFLAGAQFAAIFFDDALKNYPTDRSCITCDFLSGVTCQHWKEVIPAEAIEAGCDEHAGDGVPF